VLDHPVDFLQFFVVPTTDFGEQPPSASLRRRTHPLPVAVDDLPLSVDVTKSPHDYPAALHEPIATKNIPSVLDNTHATPPGVCILRMEAEKLGCCFLEGARAMPAYRAQRSAFEA
jgi:hypothetical protein